jgi:hypothetical protein
MYLMTKIISWYRLYLNGVLQKPIKILQTSNAKPYKVLQMIESNSYVIKFPSHFDISSTFNMKDMLIYKKQKHIFNDPYEIPTSLSL